MKNSANVISFKKRKFNKKYGKLFENYKYLLIIIGIPIILASMFMIDRIIMKKVLSYNGVDYSQYYETRIENAIDEEFREDFKK
ncbi:MAG: hypothetical protein ACRC92_17995 [Peptostreptococcaceae bacterium]